MHYAVVRRRAKLSAQHRVIFAIPYNAMQCDAMQYHATQSKTIQYMQYKEIPCNTLFKSFETSTGPMGFVFSSWMVPYGLQQCWMSRVFRCDALDTPQGYISNTKNIPQKWGHGNLGHLGQNGPFLGPRGPRRDPIPGQSEW